MDLATIVIKVKTALRVSTVDSSINAEISDVVDECIEDLKRSVGSLNLNDPLVLKACKCYAKAHYGFDDKSDLYAERYQSIKKELGLWSDYNA